MKAITELLEKTMDKLKGRKFDNSVMKVVIFYLLFVVLLLFTWYGAWMYAFYKTGASDLDALSKFIVIVLGATGFFGFIMACFVDKNHNGIPDQFEQPKKGTVQDEKHNRHF
jgi:hypothetical protein|uniref:Corticosteroid 11-beta-dehydrogenase isozyme 1 n=1 Tax=Myoviridae sp. ctAca11 TaxID=2825043 RepID=A0A8S5Q6Y7_9CAUD|nr:MAG TPA: corticosteroid 11-beta-dehydrogenase isozyme 1 [Myoviridae sp. ctAca11]